MKTWLFYANREFFSQWAFAEIESAAKKAKREGFNFSVRLNGTSDLSLELFKVGEKNVLEAFPTIQFYDYTKVYNRLDRMKKYKNYHLTFSYSGENLNECLKAIAKGYNVAIPFLVRKNKSLPSEFLGFEVEDADKTDLRFLDTKRIAALRVKITKDKSAIEYAVKKGFVIDPENFELQLKNVA